MIYKTEFFDLRMKAGKKSDDTSPSCGFVFARDPSIPELTKYMDEDGLPFQA